MKAVSVGFVVLLLAACGGSPAAQGAGETVSPEGMDDLSITLTGGAEITEPNVGGQTLPPSDTGGAAADAGPGVGGSDAGCGEGCVPAAECGDGIIDVGEACDDGGKNATGEGTCLADCSGVQICGNDIPEGSEACDDGAENGSGDDFCTADCSAIQECGNGKAEGTETCDDGPDNGSREGFCTADCNALQECGNGEIDGTETCDDGSENGSGDGFCTADCNAMQECGNGTTEGTEACDDGAATPAGEGICLPDCGAIQVCGDGSQQGSESCDSSINCQNCRRVPTLRMDRNGGCALTRQNGWYCWGSIPDKVFGFEQGTGLLQRERPAHVAELDDFADVIANDYYTRHYAVTDSGELFWWGFLTPGSRFEAESLTRTPKPLEGLPVQTAEVAKTRGFTCARSPAGEVRCWGEGTTDQSFIDPLGMSALPLKFATFTQLAAGNEHMCGTLRSGRVACWGDNSHYQLNGMNTTHAQDAEVLLWNFPADVVQVAAVSYSTCALLANGEVYCWGRNQHGVASPDEYGRVVPTKLSLDEPIVDIELGGNWTGCAVGMSGAVYCWGGSSRVVMPERNESGTKQHRPTRIEGVDDALEVALGLDVACAITKRDKVVCWGSNFANKAGSTQYAESRLDPSVVPHEVMDLRFP